MLCSAPCVAVRVCCKCGLFMQLFDLQSPYLYSCEGDLDAQTSTDFHLSLRDAVLSFLAMCEEKVPLWSGSTVCVHTKIYHHTSCKQTHKVPHFLVSPAESCLHFVRECLCDHSCASSISSCASVKQMYFHLRQRVFKHKHKDKDKVRVHMTEN